MDLPFAVPRERSPNRETVEYPDASHFLREDAGEGIAEKIKTFHRGLPAPAGGAR